MAFSDAQARQLKAKLDGQHVKARKENGYPALYRRLACNCRSEPHLRLRCFEPMGGPWTIRSFTGTRIDTYEPLPRGVFGPNQGAPIFSPVSSRSGQRSFGGRPFVRCRKGLIRRDCRKWRVPALSHRFLPF
jgi:hypothetical protein